MPPKKFNKREAVSFNLIAKQYDADEAFDPDASKYMLEVSRLPKRAGKDAVVEQFLPKSFPKDLIAQDEDYQAQQTFTRGVIDEDEGFMDHLSAKDMKRREKNILAAFADDGGAQEEAHLDAYHGYGEDEDEDYFDDEEDFDDGHTLTAEEERQNQRMIASKPNYDQKSLYQYDYNKHFRPISGAGAFYGVNGERSDPEANLPIVPAIAHDDTDLQELEASGKAKHLASKHKGTVRSLISGLELPIAPVGKGIKFTKDFMEALEHGNEEGFLDLEDNFYELAMGSDNDEEEAVVELDPHEQALIDQGMPAEVAAAMAAAKRRMTPYQEQEQEQFVEEYDGDDEEERKVRALMAKLAEKKKDKGEQYAHYNTGQGAQDRRVMGMMMEDEEDAKVRAIQAKLAGKKKSVVRFRDEEEMNPTADVEAAEEDFEEDMEFDEDDYEEWDDDGDEVTQTMRLLQEMSLRVDERTLRADATDAEIKQANDDLKFIELLREYEDYDEDEERELGLDDPSLRDINDARVKKEILVYMNQKKQKRSRITEMNGEDLKTVKSYINKRIAEFAREDDDMKKIGAAIDAQFRRKPKEQWDAESICSTYSNVDNIPSMIKEVRLRKDKQTKIQISQGIHVPIGVLKKHREERNALKVERQSNMALRNIAEEGESINYLGDNRHEMAAQKKSLVDNDDEEEDEDEYEYVQDTSIGRNKKESKEEKKARKAAIKAERAVKRAQKKQMKQMFAQEKKTQEKMDIMNKSLNAAHRKL